MVKKYKIVLAKLGVRTSLRKEKKAANALLERRRKESAEVVAANKALICDTQIMKKTIEDIKAKK